MAMVNTVPNQTDQCFKNFSNNIEKEVPSTLQQGKTENKNSGTGKLSYAFLHVKEANLLWKNETNLLRKDKKKKKRLLKDF